ncbi:type IV toxin-antitoxin system AbiEi family antitoxin domain-containing protein [Nocardioides aequoreus]|uniref:type IV toxin-antitoxin system AbiEi family antitoxin domain-containing protein n=1 Tax=Nocardioides aequoreus TaxID=397278 RepID=UPI0004C31F3D|nr:type IV toxin-antitoxin system AbiEi family antitoxin domain-containing protein [Nocardioides aequoreus]
MDPLRLIAAAEGVFLRREALDCGYDDRQIAALVRARVWHRVRRGCYLPYDVWDTLDATERHLVLAHAVRRSTPGPVVFTHATALVALGIAVWGVDLSRVHVTRLDAGAARRQPDVVHHVGRLPEDEVLHVRGLDVSAPARAVVETATVAHLEPALVSADNAQFLGLTDIDDLHRTFERLSHWPGSQKIHVLLMYTDGRHESVGETRSMVLFHRTSIPLPEPQREVYDDAGRLVAVADFDWDELGTLGEFDGRGKYFRAYDPDKSPDQVVYEEKQREDLVRGLTGKSFFRWDWTDLGRPRQLESRFWDHVRRRRAA